MYHRNSAPLACAVSTKAQSLSHSLRKSRCNVSCRGYSDKIHVSSLTILQVDNLPQQTGKKEAVVFHSHGKQANKMADVDLDGNVPRANKAEYERGKKSFLSESFSRHVREDCKIPSTTVYSAHEIPKKTRKKSRSLEEKKLKEGTESNHPVKNANSKIAEISYELCEQVTQTKALLNEQDLSLTREFVSSPKPSPTTSNQHNSSSGLENNLPSHSDSGYRSIKNSAEVEFDNGRTLAWEELKHHPQESSAVRPVSHNENRKFQKNSPTTVPELILNSTAIIADIEGNQQLRREQTQINVNQSESSSMLGSSIQPPLSG